MKTKSEIKAHIPNDLKWFKDRIGRMVYRNTETTCSCGVCNNVYKHGLIIHDETHADYLYCCQNEMGLIYIDTQKVK